MAPTLVVPAQEMIPMKPKTATAIILDVEHTNDDEELSGGHCTFRLGGRTLRVQYTCSETIQGTEKVGISVEHYATERFDWVELIPKSRFDCRPGFDREESVRYFVDNVLIPAAVQILDGV